MAETQAEEARDTLRLCVETNVLLAALLVGLLPLWVTPAAAPFVDWFAFVLGHTIVAYVVSMFGFLRARTTAPKIHLWISVALTINGFVLGVDLLLRILRTMPNPVLKGLFPEPVPDWIVYSLVVAFYLVVFYTTHTVIFHKAAVKDKTETIRGERSAALQPPEHSGGMTPDHHREDAASGRSPETQSSEDTSRGKQK